MARLAPWMQKTPPQGTAGQKAEPAPWQHAGQEGKLLDQIRAGLEASPSKIVLIVSRDHEGNAPGSWHADQLKLPGGERGWAHVSVAWVNADGRPVFAEKTPGSGAGPLVSKNKSGFVQDMAKYREVEIIPLDLSRFGPGARARFINAFLEALSRPYSGLARFGDHCSSAFEKALAAAIDPSKAAISRDLVRATLMPNVYSPNDAYLHGKQISVPFRYDPNSPTQGQTVKKDWLHPPQEGRGAVKKQPVANSVDDNAESLAALAGAITLSSETALTREQPADDDKGPSQEEIEFVLSDKVNEDALADNAPQDPEADEDADEETLEARTSDEKDASTQDAGQQPAIDDDVDDDDEPVHDEVILASDPEDARTDDDLRQPATDDDDEEPSQAIDEEEEQADASDAQAATGSTDATADDQAGQLATSAPAAADEGFSFSLFPKPGAPTEVAKEALPPEQASPGEQGSGPGAPESESAHPDLGSADVGNAAPSNERVVHHGDLAP
jgi:hypothetical protein